MTSPSATAVSRNVRAAPQVKSIDPGVLAKMMKDLKTSAERVKKLRALVYEWPDDFALAIVVGAPMGVLGS